MINLLFPILLPIEVALPGAWHVALPTLLPVASRWCAQPKLRLPDGFLCRNCAFKVLLVAKLRFPDAALAANEHKNPDSVLEKPENRGSEGQKSTKTPILCSKCPKTGVPKAKKAQKPRFCARNARKRGFRRPKKHKNPDFVLEMPENGGSRPKKRTKMAILCSGRRGMASGTRRMASGSLPRGAIKF